MIDCLAIDDSYVSIIKKMFEMSIQNTTLKTDDDFTVCVKVS